MRSLIDYQFETYTEIFFKKQVKIYFFGYVLPIAIQLFSHSDALSAVSLIIALLTQFYLVLNEVIQMQEGGLGEYFGDSQNRIDLIMFVINVMYVVRRLLYLPFFKFIIASNI